MGLEPLFLSRHVLPQKGLAAHADNSMNLQFYMTNGFTDRDKVIPIPNFPRQRIFYAHKAAVFLPGHEVTIPRYLDFQLLYSLQILARCPMY